MGRQTYSGQTVLIVGGAGFIGGNLCRRILADSPTRLVIADNLLSSDIRNVPVHERVEFIQGSIAEDRTLMKLGRDFDYVFHLATYHGNQSSIHDPLADHANNTITTLKLFDWLSRSDTVKKVVYASAGCTVAEKTFDSVGATDEEAPISLYHDSPYQISKLIGEFYSNYYWGRTGFPVVKARFQNVYGPGEILGAGQWRGTPATVWRNVVPSFIIRAMAHQAVPLENAGVSTRDFIYVDDIVDGLSLCALEGAPGEVYNLASGIETSIKDLALLINELVANPVDPLSTGARDWDRSGRRYGSTSKSSEQLGFTASVSLDEGLRRTIGWTEENIDLITNCMEQHRRYVDLDFLDAINPG